MEGNERQSRNRDLLLQIRLQISYSIAELNFFSVIRVLNDKFRHFLQYLPRCETICLRETESYHEILLFSVL